MFLDLNVSPNERLFGMIGCAVGFLVLVYLAFRIYRHIRLISDTPTALIRSAPQGYVEIIGHVIAGENGMLNSPLSQRPCVWYRIKVERRERSSDNKRDSWRTVRNETSESWFQINDNTGTCLVDPEGAIVKTRHKQVWFGSSEYPGSGYAMPGSGGFAQVGVFSRYKQNILGSSGRFRYTEELIFEYEPLYALAEFRSVGGGRERLDLKTTSAEILRDWKADQAALIDRFDADGDGKIDLQEWEQARLAARKEARARQGELDEIPTMHVLMNPDLRGHPYLLSTFDEEQLLTRNRWYMAGLMACALLAFWLGLELMLTTAV
ncbi:MAG: hypothetical protein CMI01_01645 [Oceanospirillaceae bacterium]|nr:hypothetical protein [Oceanospirillaceae bacterium]